MDRDAFSSAMPSEIASLSEATGAAPASRDAAERNSTPLIRALSWLLVVIAAWYFLWPVYRAFLNIEIDTNEGWNAFFADAAMGRMPLYPSADRLITNNYPPLSFYIVGGLGRVIGDPLLAGRLLSLAVVLGIAAAISVAVRHLGGSRLGAGIGAAFFVATMSRFFDRYVGMDDPQLLAQAVMACGFAGFLRAESRGRGWLGPILLMAVAGFFKHNIIAMPFTALLWLVSHRPREGAKCIAAASILVALGFAACFALYGRDFFLNMLFSRQYSWARVLHYLDGLKQLNVGLAASIMVGWWKRRDPSVQICSLFVALALASTILQWSGAGVDQNAQFDLLIAVSIGVALAFTHGGRAPQSRLLGPAVLQTLLLLAIDLRFLPPKNSDANRSYRLVFDRTFRSEIALREQATAASVARVRATPGEVMSTNFVCYRAGKPFAIDRFNARQRMKTGALPPDAVKSRIDSGQLTLVEADPLASWD